VFTALALAACSPDSLLDVDDVDVLDPGTLNTREALPTLLAGSLSAFQIAFSGAGDLSNGGHEGMVNMSALLADEYIHAETFPHRQGVDVRSISPGNGAVKGVFLDLSQARAVADQTSSRYHTFDAGAAGHAEVLSLAGYSREPPSAASANRSARTTSPRRSRPPRCAGSRRRRQDW
jgi:hypothetical protein